VRREQTRSRQGAPGAYAYGVTETAALFLQDDPLDRAKRHIEANLFEPLTLGALAEVARLSPYHFTRQFGARFGMSPMAYVRARRLVSAARRLSTDDATSLIHLAFDCGFDSQEGFTRAFKRAFGVPPGRYRRSDVRPPIEILAMHETAPVPIALTQSARPAAKGPLRVAGLAAVFNDETKGGIPKLWDRLVPMLPLDGQDGYETFGVCSAAPAGSEPGSMRYLAGVSIGAGAPAPAGAEVIELDAQAYVIFRQVMDGGPVHPQMQAAVKAIWGERLPKSGCKLAQAPDIEFYSGDFAPDRAGAWVEWWVPVAA
jgi:AraC family transcriptional regulator